MRAVLILCVVIAAAVACPCIKPKKDCCSTSIPAIIPPNWKVKMFTTQSETITCQGTWFVQLTTPMYLKDNLALKTGMFCNTFPSTKNRFIFTDTTPCNDADWNIEYVVCDSSYNVYTNKIENTRLLFRPAFGKESKLAVYNVGSPKYYQKTISELYPFVDDKLIRHKIGKTCEREYTVAQIGGDKANTEYIVFAVVNKYASYIKGTENMVYVLTRKEFPSWSTYSKAFDDIEASGLNPYLLTSVDHSVDFKNIPSITPDDINGVMQTVEISSTSSSSTKSISSDSTSTSSSTSSVSTSTTTTTSTVVVEIQKDYVSPYELFKCEYFQDKYQMMKPTDALTLRKALSGKYFLSHSTPFKLSDSKEIRPGIGYTLAPSVSNQVVFDHEMSDSPWDSKTQYMGIDQAYNQRTGELVRTRFLISSLFDDDHKYGRSLVRMCTEGYYRDDIPEQNPWTFDGMLPRPSSEIFTREIILSVLGCNPDEYLLLRIVNNYKNLLFDDDDIPVVFAYTRDRVPSADTVHKITQELLRCGINPNIMSVADQSMTIDEKYTFLRTTFETETSCWSSSSSSSSSSSINSSSSRCITSKTTSSSSKLSSIISC